MKKALFIFCLLALSVTIFFSQQKDFSRPSGPYLGQKPPGTTPEVFAPGIVSTKADEYVLEVSPSGDEILFIRNSKVMLAIRNSDGSWNKPVVAPFSGKYIDDEPCYSPDGGEIYFMSRRPLANSKLASNLWVAKRHNSTWKDPEPVSGIIYQKTLHAPSVAANGNIYDDGIVRFRKKNDKYQTEEMKISSNPGFPFISPDESYIIFAIRLPGKTDTDLFISFHKEDGTWSKGISLGQAINSPYNETNSFVTADGKYLFFARKFDIYWVSADIIKRLKQ